MVLIFYKISKTLIIMYQKLNVFETYSIYSCIYIGIQYLNNLYYK